MALIEARGTNGLQLTRSFEARTWAWKGSEDGFLSRARVFFCLQWPHGVTGGCARRARGRGAVRGRRRQGRHPVCLAFGVSRGRLGWSPCCSRDRSDVMNFSSDEVYLGCDLSWELQKFPGAVGGPKNPQLGFLLAPRKALPPRLPRVRCLRGPVTAGSRPGSWEHRLRGDSEGCISASGTVRKVRLKISVSEHRWPSNGRH